VSCTLEAPLPLWRVRVRASHFDGPTHEWFSGLGRVFKNPHELEKIVASKRKVKSAAKRKKPDAYSGLQDLLRKRGYSSPYEFARALYKYTDCGPWTVFIVRGAPKGSVYYEDASARECGWINRCTGLKIGSIVEGSDVEIGPEQLLFPFTEEDLDRIVSSVNEEACFYWERDNSHYYTVLTARGKPLFHAQWVEFADEPTGNFSKAQAMLAHQAGELIFASSAPQGAVIAITGTEYFVREEAIPNITY
jgi:hypothetical protein